MTAQTKPIMAKKRRRRRKKYRILLPILMIAILVQLLRMLSQLPLVTQSLDFMTGKLSYEVRNLQPTVEEYATYYGIPEYVPYLLAIMEVESGGEREDVMQASESLGLPPNSLSTEASIKQGVVYFKKLINLAAENGCDVKTAVQAYNYGPGFIDFVSERGGLYTDELAEEFARLYSGGSQVNYYNLIALKENGGWRYDYGNMFYVRLIERFS